MELHELEVRDRRARAIRHREPVAGRDVGVARVEVDLAAAAGGEHGDARGDRAGCGRVARSMHVGAPARVAAPPRRAAAQARVEDQVDGELVLEQPDARVRAHAIEQRALDRLAGEVARVHDAPRASARPRARARSRRRRARERHAQLPRARARARAPRARPRAPRRGRRGPAPQRSVSRSCVVERVRRDRTPRRSRPARSSCWCPRRARLVSTRTSPCSAASSATKSPRDAAAQHQHVGVAHALLPARVVPDRGLDRLASGHPLPRDLEHRRPRPRPPRGQRTASLAVSSTRAPSARRARALAPRLVRA